MNKGFYSSCKEGHLELVKFFTSNNLKEYIHSLDGGFLWTVTNKNVEMLQYFIFDLNIPKTTQISNEFDNILYRRSSLSVFDISELENRVKMAQKMFETRELTKELSEELPNENKAVKPKINKL